MKSVLLVFSDITKNTEIAQVMKNSFHDGYFSPITESTYIIAKDTPGQEDYLKLIDLELSDDVFEEYFNEDCELIKAKTRSLINVVYRKQASVVELILKVINVFSLIGIQLEFTFLTTNDIMQLDFNNVELSEL